MDAAPGGARHRLEHSSRWLVFVAALVTCLVLATGAEAATISLGGKAITYSAGQGEENHVTVRTGPTETRVDDVVPITAGAGCSAHPTTDGWTASCSSADGGWIYLHDGADELTFDPASEASAHGRRDAAGSAGRLPAGREAGGARSAAAVPAGRAGGTGAGEAAGADLVEGRAAGDADSAGGPSSERFNCALSGSPEGEAVRRGCGHLV